MLRPAVLDAGAQQQLGRPERAAGEHDRLGADLERTRRPVALGGAARQLSADRALALEEDPPRLDAGAHARARGDGARQVARRASRASRRACSPGGRSCTARSRPAFRSSGSPLAPSAAAPSISSWPLRPMRSGSTRLDGEHLLGLGVVGVEVGRPVDPVGASRQLSRRRLRRAEAGARVDHRRAADGAADRHRDRGQALGDGQAAVAVQRPSAPRAARRGSCGGRGRGRPRARARRARPRRGRSRRPRRRRRSRR